MPNLTLQYNLVQAIVCFSSFLLGLFCEQIRLFKPKWRMCTKYTKDAEMRKGRKKKQHTMHSTYLISVSLTTVTNSQNNSDHPIITKHSDSSNVYF